MFFLKKMLIVIKIPNWELWIHSKRMFNLQLEFSTPWSDDTYNAVLLIATQ